MIRRLRLKFVLINMTIVTLMLCVILGLVLHFTRANLEEENLRMMESIATQPFQVSAPGDLGEDVRLPFFALQLGPRGELMARTGGYYDLSDEAMLRELIQTAWTSHRPMGVIEEYNLRYYRVETPASRCLVFSDISSEQATLSGLRTTCLIIGGISFFVFLWASVVLSKWAVKPVEQAWKQQREFVASASHELKTPLTVIMTNAELMQDPAYGADKRAAFLDSILTMSRQMRGLIEQMLELARADSGATELGMSPMNLSQTISLALLPFEAVFFEQGLTLSSQLEPDIQVQGAESQLRQVVEILLDNAQKYAYPNTGVEVTLRRRGRGHCVLTVSNQGDPMSPQELRDIFKRFYRADPARSRTGSFGLGLSIAQGIVTRHRGKIWAESREGINRFLVELPCI